MKPFIANKGSIFSIGQLSFITRNGEVLLYPSALSRYFVAYFLEKIDVNDRFILVSSLAYAKLQQRGQDEGRLSLRGDPL